MKLLTTKYIGFGIGFDYIIKELSIHFLIWCIEIKF